MSAPTRLLTEAEYLAVERRVEERHEFFRGKMFSLGGSNSTHNRVTVNLAGILGNQLRDRDYVAAITNLRVKITATSLYTYPDVVVTCEKPEFEDEHLDTLLNPQVVMEVLTKTTESYDRGKKFEHYRRIPSLKEYVLVSQDHPHIERFSLDDTGKWYLSEATGLEATMELTSIDCQLSLAEVFAKVEFSEAE